MKIYITRLGAEWCGPCRTMKPIFNEVKQELETNDLVFEELGEDDKEMHVLAQRFEVKNIPHILITDDTKTTLYGRIIGTMSKEELKNKIINIVEESKNI